MGQAYSTFHAAQKARMDPGRKCVISWMKVPARNRASAATKPQTSCQKRWGDVKHMISVP